MEAAIRSSNAQYDDPDILRRLDVRLLEMSPGDSGWDVFSLDYHVDSPVNTILTPVAMHQYLKMFNFLWRLKRVEYALSSAWRRQTTSARAIRPILGKHFLAHVFAFLLACSACYVLTGRSGREHFFSFIVWVGVSKIPGMDKVKISP